jgi:hypothetical protein
MDLSRGLGDVYKRQVLVEVNLYYFLALVFLAGQAQHLLLNSG